MSSHSLPLPSALRTLRSAAAGFVLASTLALAACSTTAVSPPAETTGSTAEGQVLRVPEDAKTITKAIERANPGDMVLVGPGVFAEQVQIDVPNLTLRGVDRNETIIDGEGVRPYGVVAIADGVRVENLTVREATFYGVLVTGLHDKNGPSARGVDGYTTLNPDEFPPVQRFSVDHVTAHNNGLYGLYAFNAQHGIISNSYASGSADSGIYVGQCENCDILVTGNVAERNAIGFENANASDSLVIAGNRFTNNRVGATLISSYQEAFTPQRGNTFVGNLVADNAETDSPAQAEGGFGVGLGISGGQSNAIDRNTFSGNPSAGVQFTNVEDLAAERNSFTENGFAANGVDLANTSSERTPASGNCLTAESGAAPTTVPATLFADCESVQPAETAAKLPALTVPSGVSFLKVAAPIAQPSLPASTTIPPPLPATITLPDLATFTTPAANFLADRAGTR